MSRRAVTAAIVVLLAAPCARAETGWAGAIRIGVGGALNGARAGQGAVDLALNLQTIIRPGAYDQSWGGGPFFDAHTLGFDRHDVSVGGAVSTPDYLRLYAGGVQVGAGYRWRSDAENGAIAHATFVFHVRIPIKMHEEVLLGLYADARVVLVARAPTELTTGLEIDPVGIIAGLYQRAQSP